VAARLGGRRLVQLFYNPAAGSYNGETISALTRALRDTGARVTLTPSIDHPPAIDPAATHICIAGGDGTVRHVAEALVSANRPLPVAIYPAGTINLLAREAGFGRRPARLARALAEGRTRPHGPVEVRSAHGEDASMFFACASVGPDSLAVADVSASSLKRHIGRFAYVAAMGRLLSRWPRHRLVVAANGERWECEAVYIAKGRYYAGSWSFAPQAKVDDGQLHVVALRRARRREMLQFYWTMLSGGDVTRGPNVIAFSCTALSLEAEEGMPLQGDGDILATGPVEIALGDTPVNIC
jgi:diacylglycerol kinase family enzyme